MAQTGNVVDVPNLSGLSEEERHQVITVLQRAQEFEDEESRLLRRPLEGQLTKFTNVVKGWLPRWFVLDPDTGMLEYFEKEEHKKMRPRGCLFLAGAVVCPSDEDSQTFSVHANNGEIIRVRAQDAKGRQHWVDRLRRTAEFHTASLSKGSASNSLCDIRPSQPLGNDPVTMNKPRPDQSAITHRPATHAKTRLHDTHLPESLRMVKEHQAMAEDLCSTLHHQIMELPVTGELGRYDNQMLLLKATSAAALRCMNQCFSTLHQQHIAITHPRLPSSAAVRWYRSKPIQESIPSLSNEDFTISPASQSSPVGTEPTILDEVSPDSGPEALEGTADPVDHEAELEDVECYCDTELGSVDEHKTVILNLLSQLKLGMDLTKVVLPTFILEKRSLLEMFADCMAHPHLFLRIAEYKEPEARMIAVLRWYLSSFHAGRQGSIAKKPYNPIIGEVFRCSWDLSHAQMQSEDVSSEGSESDVTRESGTPSRLVYCAEQVSHHPPVTAFHCECSQQQICLNASVWTKSKFMGMSIGVEMIGPLTVRLLGHSEDYHITLPSVFARSILTVPWVEMGEKLNIVCPQTSHAASVTFHTKPFYGGRLHRVSAEVKNSTSIVCRVVGEWNSVLDFSYTDGRKETMDVTKLAVFKKRVCPLDIQKPYESRKLWENVTTALRAGDKVAATKHKYYLEERQRHEEKTRRDTNTAFPTKFFHKVDDAWIFNKTLENDQHTVNL